MNIHLFYNKQETTPIEGLYCDAMDYNFIESNKMVDIPGYVLGFIISFLAIQVFFMFLPLSVIAGIAGAIYLKPLYRDYLINKQKDQLLDQFKSLLDSINSSFTAGDNTRGAFSNALVDMESIYGNDAYITKELEIINEGIKNNITIEDLLKNFSDRSHLKDINDFVTTFNTCLIRGGNLKEVVSQCKDIITLKIDTEMEIKTVLSSNKMQLYILVVMPFVLVGLMTLMGFSELMALNFTTIFVKAVALVAFFIAFIIGENMTRIEV